LYTFEGHTDYVKSLLFVPSLGVLLSGSTDASLRVWTHASPSKEPELLHTLKGHSRAIEDISIDWSNSTQEQIIVFTASSDRTIRKWNISATTAAEEGEELIIHETSVYAIKVDQDDIWTCTFSASYVTNVGSADKTAKRYDRTEHTQETFVHPDLVKDVLVHDGFLYTACSDENIRQWSLDVFFWLTEDNNRR
jgi:WD40 repeat protein